MFGMIPFVKAAGKAMGSVFKGKDAEDKLKKEVEDYGLNTDGVDITVADDGVVTVGGEAVSQEMKEMCLATHSPQFLKNITVRGSSTPRFLKRINQCSQIRIKSIPVRFCAFQRLTRHPLNLFPVICV